MAVPGLNFLDLSLLGAYNVERVLSQSSVMLVLKYAWISNGESGI